MSDIRFIQAQGDLLDDAIRADLARQTTPARSGHKRLWSYPHPRFAAFAVALVLAGCAVAAATGVFSSSERLALGTVDCYYSDGVHVIGAAGYDTLETGASLSPGQTPAQLCEAEFDANEPSFASFGARPLQNPRVISCRENATSSVVFIGTGTAFIGSRFVNIGPETVDACQRLGLAPLPSNFSAATASVQALAAQLRSLYLSRDCWPPSAFVNEVRATLLKDGLTDWRVDLPTPNRAFSSPYDTVGRCATFAFLDGTSQTVNLGLGSPRSINSVITRADNTLSNDTQNGCYSPATVRALVDRTFAGSRMTPQVAITTNPNGGIGTFSFGSAAANRHFFDDGCVLLFGSTPAVNNRIVYVWLIARDGIPLTPLHPSSHRPTRSGLQLKAMSTRFEQLH